jgi:hypothetical protein
MVFLQDFLFQLVVSEIEVLGWSENEETTVCFWDVNLDFFLK